MFTILLVVISFALIILGGVIAYKNKDSSFLTLIGIVIAIIGVSIILFNMKNLFLF